MASAIETVNYWVEERAHGRMVTFTNVHMVVEAQVHPSFRTILEGMDLNCPDGAPVYWLTKRMQPGAEKISGPDFMPRFCKQSAALGHKHFLYGGPPGVAQATAEVLSRLCPGIRIVGHHSPPFRDLTSEESEEVIREINDSGADLVWVCLGCPRQEIWMSEHRSRLHAKVLLAVGQAFDIVAGRTSRAPVLLQRCGLEWVFRLCQEPRRLWKRYLVTNLLFTLLLAREKLTGKAA